MKWIDKIFGCRQRQEHERPEQQTSSRPLRIEGIGDAPLTPEPDDAELAAQAVLELMAQEQHATSASSLPDTTHSPLPDAQTTERYEALALRLREAHEAARRRTVRFLAYCEKMLAQPSLPATGPNSLSLIEAELYKRIDIVERNGGELKRRWQHCLATVTVRLMKATDQMTDDTTIG